MYLKILIIISIVLTSFLLKKAGVLSKKDGEVILNKILFYLVIPAAVFLSISQTQLSLDLIFLPLSEIGIALTCFSAAFLYAKWAKLDNRTKGVLFAGVTMMNLQMVAYPFLKFVYGDEAFVRLVLFDFAGAIMAFTFVYFIAIYYGASSEERNIKISLLKFIKVPLVWALFLGISVNLSPISLPDFIKDFLELIEKPLVPLLLVALGLYFEPRLNKMKHLLAGIFIRIGIGFAAGLLMVTIFHLEGLNQLVVLVCSIMPAGYNTLVFSAKEKLDEEFAASFVSISVIVSLILIPILSFFLGY